LQDALAKNPERFRYQTSFSDCWEAYKFYLSANRQHQKVAKHHDKPTIWNAGTIPTGMARKAYPQNASFLSPTLQ
jgi:hypothetical protein